MISKDARGFIDGVAAYMQNDVRGKKVLPKVQSLFSKVTVAAKKERMALVTSAIALTQNEKASVVKIITKLVGHDVECQFELDRALLGGMKIQIADWIVDTSLSRQLSHLTQSLL